MHVNDISIFIVTNCTRLKVGDDDTNNMECNLKIKSYIIISTNNSNP